MTLPLLRRSRRPDNEVDGTTVDEAPAADPSPSPVQWSGGSALLARATTLGLWLLLLTGPALLVALLATGGFTRPPTAARAAPAAASSIAQEAAAGELAERAVLVWLTTRRGQERTMAVPLPGYSGHAKPFAADQLSVADIRPAGDDVWSVTVGATVTDSAKRTRRQYFQVPVQVGPAASAVLALPAVVAAPQLVAGTPPKYRQPLAVSGAIGSTVSQFLAALTAGAGDVTRYVAPGQTIRAVSSPPFTAVTVTDLNAGEELSENTPPADGSRAQLLVSAVGRTASGQQLPVAYALTVRARAGRWEIESIQPAPNPTAPATPPQTPPAAKPTGTPSPSR